MVCDECGGSGNEIMEWHGMTMSVPCFICNGTGNTTAVGIDGDLEELDLPEEPDEPESDK